MLIRGFRQESSYKMHKKLQRYSLPYEKLNIWLLLRRLLMASASAHHTSTIANEISQVGKAMYLHYLCGRFIYCISEHPVNQMISQLLRVALLCHLFLHIAASAGDHEFTFNGFSYANLSLDGDVNLAANGLLQLTNATLQSKGQAFYPSPLRFKMHNWP